jgi:PKD repeat protein
VVGTPFTSAGSFSDESPGTATATVDYGDGAGPQPLALTGTTFALSHTYATPGTKTVTVKVTDSGLLSGTDTAQVTVTSGTNPPGHTASVTKAVAQPRKITKGKGFKALVTVTTTAGVPAGTVQVYKGGKLLGTGTLANGKVTIKVSKKLAKRFKVGKVTLTAKYLGSATVAPSQADFVIKVKKKR